MNYFNKIGFMQGRLSPLSNGRIQSFPWDNWENEFISAEKINIYLMEWTLDQERLHENPLLIKHGQVIIRDLCMQHKVNIPSLTGDCFMQAPIWKSQGPERIKLESDFIKIVEGCAAVGITMIVFPLVDNGRLESLSQENNLIFFLEEHAELLITQGIKILFESDYAPLDLAKFIARLDPNLFGINYDIGNSAALGFKPKEEIASYGLRIMNIHIKDRILGGTTVPLGMGNANFSEIFSELSKINYQGNFILQTARAADENHSKILSNYRDMTINWLKNYAN
ncbi:IolE Sugar phosphate isomerases/epimerases [Methylophilaceae bacterium]